MSLTTQRLLADTYTIVPLTFSQVTVTDSQTAVALKVLEAIQGATVSANSVTTYEAPWAGTVVAVTATVSAAATAGECTVVPTIGGVACTDPAAVLTLQSSATDLAASRDTNVFAAGAEIGAAVTTDAAWNGTASDLLVTVWVLFETTGIA